MAKRRSIVSRILRWILFSFVTIIVLFGGFLGYMTLADYKPDPIEDVPIIGGATDLGIPPDTFTLVTWNIGYGGLGAEQDFFFDGGKNVRPSKELYQKYIGGIINTISEFDGADFILLQEVDRNSKRSYFDDQLPKISGALSDYYYGYATNYKTQFVPQPLANPYGKCFGGLVTLSKYKPAAARRFKLAQDATWPTGLFMLKRCYMEFRYPMPDGKDLVVINQHLSAYDDGTVKQKQMDSLKAKLLKEYKAGNYIITGGDWNQFPPDYKPKLSGSDGVVGINVDKDFPEAGWSWAYDLNVSTNRKLNTPYSMGTTEEVVIDYFLLSPNLSMISVEGKDLGFVNSDHQPVFIKVAIKRVENLQ